MSCEYVQERISSLLDQRVDPVERETVLAHIESCRTCSAHYESMQSLRSALLSVAAPPLPAGLHQKLRVLASHEHARRVSRLTLAARMRHLSDRLQLAFDNIMRPFGVPAASGLLSAVLLFTLLVPNLSFAHRGDSEGPVELITSPLITSAGAGSGGEAPEIEDPGAFGSHYEAVLELKITPEGKVWDWSVVEGSPDLTPELQSIILFARFQPATIFGQPTWGTAKIYYRHSFTYVVRG